MSSSTSTLANSERTPLIPKSQSQVIVSCTDQNGDGDGDGDQESVDDGKGGREVEVYKPGKSSFTQTVSIFSTLILSWALTFCDRDCEM